MRNRPTSPTVNRQQRATLDRLVREHAPRRVIIEEAPRQTLRALLADARAGQSLTFTITRGGFLA